MSHPHLFSPLRLGNREVKNRLAFIATVSNFGADNSVTDRLIRFYAARAEGGCGMIISEGLVVHPTSVPQPAIVDLSRSGLDAGLASWAEAVERHGCRLLGQLWHVGRQQLWNPIASPWGVSDQPDALSWTVPHVMTVVEIEELVAAFVAGARRLERAGFSGAELHGAHGYLITQFLSPWSNTREDGYGGDLEGRTRFLREIVAGIRAECGPDFILGLKLPADEGVPGGIDPAESRRITDRLAGAGGLDYLAYSQGNFSLSLEHHLPDMHWPAGPFLDMVGELRGGGADGGRPPVMGLGRVTDADHAERLLAEGVCDLVGMSRALVADPALAERMRAEQPVRPCTFCNVCWGEIHAGKPIACFLNTRVGAADEVTPLVEPVARARRVVVVGAGLGGLAAAAAAAERGHAVTLLGRSPQPGGKARLESLLPGRAEVHLAVDHLLRRCDAAGVRLQLGIEADADAVRELAPDAVVLATGATMRSPPLAEGSSAMTDLREAIAGLAAPGGRQPGTAVLFDQDHTAAVYAAAELLAERFQRVLLLTPRVQIARAVPYVSGIGVYRRLYRAGVEIVLAAVPESLRDGRLTWRNPFNGQTAEVTNVVFAAYATPRRADDALAAPLRDAGPVVHLVGDCYSPRTALAAVHEGERVGREL